MPYVTPTEAANAVGVNPRTLARWSEDGKIKVIKTEAGQRRYDIAEYLKQKSGTTELARPSTFCTPESQHPAKETISKDKLRHLLQVTQAQKLSQKLDRAQF
jgi:DNA-binding transcriptional MerR regulator